MKNLDVKVLDKIVKGTIAAVEKSKTQIFDIYEAARAEMEKVRRDVDRIKQETADIIFKVDELEKKERRSRLRLMEVSRNFRQYTESDIKGAYEDTSNVQLELAMARLQEQNLRRQRDDLELRLKSLKDTVEKAEGLVSQVGAVLGYLGNQMGEVVTQIESLQASQIFGAKIIRAQEEERRRVAREIHDGPAQAMANIVFRAEVCERLIDTDIARSKNELKDLREQVRVALRETRKIIFDLRPMTLDDLGLVPTIRRVLDTLKERSGIFPEVKIMGEEKRLDSHIEIGLFRIIQEALNNVEKHSQASLVWVRIDFRPSVVSAVVEDDGRGFDSAENIGNESFGLMGMRERINLLSGELNIKSESGKGTRIFVTVPLKQ
ncbi:sensor histidine kinase [Sporomusa malonica]|uniref:histidine kinase n=1 Tax=Sporomusa malonica TaxID=112901 RepID=A0A1W2BFW9_9FIRM|nr:sensor histidine kinase [Sporomusa malonica]SMC71761.1 two-component system, NarL family, sensor histidine kinase DegS [Sporomusa malonica]